MADPAWEKERILAARQGDLEAFGDLVLVHQGPLRGFLALLGVAGDEVEDLAQETFIAAFRGLDAFDASQPVGPWLRGIARNMVLRRRSERARSLRRLDALRSELATRDSSDQELSAIADLDQDRLVLLRRCLEGLPAAMAELLQHRYVEDLNASEIAARSGKSSAAVRMMLSRLRDALRACVERRGQPEGAA